MKVALVQTRTPATHVAALAHVLPLVREAAAGGATFIATPEGTNILQKDRARLLPQLKSLDDDIVVTGLRQAAKDAGAWLLIGSALVLREDGKAANRSMLVSPDGAVAATYDKLHMFDVDLPTGESSRESATYEPGDRAETVRAGELKLGMSVCYDLRFPALYRALALAGAEVLTIPSAFTRPTGAAHWEAWYTFSTGHKVHNIIEAHFEFKDGLIVRHKDSFDLQAWARQALGLMGRVLGGTDMLQNKVRAQAAKGLEEYLAKS